MPVRAVGGAVAVDEPEEEQNRLIQRLLSLTDAVRGRLSGGDRDFARELAEAGEWELAIETITDASRQRRLLTNSERAELAEIQALLGRLQPEIRWRSLRALVRGVLHSLARRRLRRGRPHMRPPAVQPMPDPGIQLEPPLLREAMPTVATWLDAGLRHDGEALLAEQVDTARIHALCECGEDYCYSFYLMPPTPVGERRGRWEGLTPNGFESIAIDAGHMAWVQHEFRGPIDAVTEEGLQAICEYQALVGVVPRATV